MVSSRPLVSSMLGISSPSITVVSAAQEVQMVPPAFAGFRYSTWSKSEVEDAVDLLGGMSDGKWTKRELFEQLYKLRSDYNLTRQEELKLKARRYKEMKRKAKSATRKAKIRRQRRAIKNELEYLSIPSSMECEIGFERITLELFISGKISSSCSHDSTTSICRPCLQHSITIQSASAGWDRVGCPVADCCAILQYSDFQHHASTETFQRYDQFLLNQAVNSESTYRACAHSGCKSGGLCDPKNDSFVTCGSCERLSCIVCNTPHHAGKSCAENQAEMREIENLREAEVKFAAARKEEDKKCLAYVSKKTKACPNKDCGINIQKKGGCDHMACKFCRHRGLLLPRGATLPQESDTHYLTLL